MCTTSRAAMREISLLGHLQLGLVDGGEFPVPWLPPTFPPCHRERLGQCIHTFARRDPYRAAQASDRDLLPDDPRAARRLLGPAILALDVERHEVLEDHAATA